MPDQKNIVVTGATGMIGRRVVERLVGRGDRVTALVRDPAAAARELPAEARSMRWSHADDAGKWRGAIDGAHAIVNLAGAPLVKRWNAEHKKLIYDSRVLGTQHIVDAIERAQNRPDVLVSGSAVGFYGALVPDRVDESSPAGTDFLARLCRDWESAALRAEAFGTRVVLVRTGLVLHPDDGLLKQMLLPFRLFAGGPIGSGRQPFPWVHVDDEVGMILWALDNAAVRGPVNATAPEMVTNREFSRALGRAMRRPSVLPIPGIALRALFGEGAEMMTGGQRAVPAAALDGGYAFRHPDLEQALGTFFA